MAAITIMHFDSRKNRKALTILGANLQGLLISHYLKGGNILKLKEIQKYRSLSDVVVAQQEPQKALLLSTMLAP